MSILVIGGTGIISTGIVWQLVERGDEVVVYNRGLRPAQIESGYITITRDRKTHAAFEGQMREAGAAYPIIEDAERQPSPESPRPPDRHGWNVPRIAPALSWRT